MIVGYTYYMLYLHHTKPTIKVYSLAENIDIRDILYYKYNEVDIRLAAGRILVQVILPALNDFSKVRVRN